jgi:predicted negative regulator of RcsB-dependent stress response
MAINIKPDISLSAKPPATMTLPEMINMARSAQAYQREQEIFPELVQQAKTQTQQSQFTLDKDQTAGIMSLVGGYRNDPRINSGNSDQAREAMSEIRSKAVAIGIPEKRVDDLMRMGNAIAVRNPAKLGQYFDNVIQSQIGPTGQQALQTPQLTTSGGAPAFLRTGPATITPANIVQPEVAPAPAITPAAPAAAPQVAPSPKGVTSADMVASRNDPGFPLPYPVRRAGDIRPFAPGEESATVEGQSYIKNLSTVGSTAPMALDRVDRVMQTIAKIESSRDFQAGKVGELEGRLRAALGDADYKLLEKELADLTIATNQAIGGKTDASTALVAQSMGNTSFPPGTLRNVVTKLRGDAYGAMLEAKGANKFLQLGLNEANLPRGYKAAWDDNKDVRVYEAMAIFASDRLTPKEKIEAYNKIKPTDLESLIEFERKAKNIESLANTGTLPRQKR